MCGLWDSRCVYIYIYILGEYVTLYLFKVENSLSRLTERVSIGRFSKTQAVQVAWTFVCCIRTENEKLLPNGCLGCVELAGLSVFNPNVNLLNVLNLEIEISRYFFVHDKQDFDIYFKHFTTSIFAVVERLFPTRASVFFKLEVERWCQYWTK